MSLYHENATLACAERAASCQRCPVSGTSDSRIPDCYDVSVPKNTDACCNYGISSLENNAWLTVHE